MNRQQLPVNVPPIASSSRLPPIKTLHFDDQDQAQAAAALLQIKRSPSSAHAPLLPSFQELHSAYSNAYPTPGDRPADASSGTLFPYLPPIRTDFQQYKPQASAGPSTATPAYFSSVPTTFLPYQYPPSASHPHSPASPPRKRKRNTLLELAPPITAPDPNGKGKYRESELTIDVEGDGDHEMRQGGGNDEGEGEVRCICGYNMDDGFTIQCERCHVWQHAACFSIPSNAVPDVYLCERCNPYSASHRPLDYEGARRMQQQRLGLTGPTMGTLGLDNTHPVIGADAGASPAVRGGARRKRTESPKVERKSRGGAGGAPRRRASNAAPQTQSSVDDAGGGVRKPAAASSRKPEASAPTARHMPLHASHPNATANTPAPNSHTLVVAPPDRTPNAHRPWTEQYVPITRDIVHPAVRPVLRSFAHAWRGVTAFSDADADADTHDELSTITSCTPMPAPPSPVPDTDAVAAVDRRKTFLHPLSSALMPPSRPPTYTLHALRPIARQSYVVPYTCAITPSREYLREPTSQYAQLGVPKQGVHLVPPPLELCLDARGVGGEGRWVRSGCHPNAVLRPVVCGRAGGVGDAGKTRERELGEGVYERREGEGRRGGDKDGMSGSRADTEGGGAGGGDEPPDVTFGVFAIRDLKAHEEIVLGWEWDDRHVVHELPRLLKEGYGSGTPALKRAMGEVLSTLFSTFTTCACGASAHNCAITQMQKFADLHSSDAGADTDTHAHPDPDPDLLPHEQQQHRTSSLRDQRPPQPSPDLGPLIGATRGLRTTDRGQGGREGVEPLSASPSVSATGQTHTAPSVESVARAFRGVGVGVGVGAGMVVASDSGSDANSRVASPAQKRVHFPTSAVPVAPEVVVSTATGTPSPRKTWERRYSESRSIDTSEEEGEAAHGGAHKPPKKKARTTPRVDVRPGVADDVDDDGDGEDAPMLEDTLPPKFRKNWIKETVRVLNTEGHDAEEDHVSVQYEAMDVEAANATVEPSSVPRMEVDSPLVPLQSPSTALAGLSLRGSPVDNREVGVFCDHGAEVPEAPVAAEASVAPEVSAATEAPEVPEAPTIPKTFPSPPRPNPTPSWPEQDLHSTQPDDMKPDVPSLPPSPIASLARPHSAEPPSLPVAPIAAPTSPVPNVTPVIPVTPLLPSSDPNANFIPSPTHHIPSVASEPPSAPALPPAAPPSNSDDAAHQQLAQPAPSLPAPPPKKPPIKRRTLADWKSRKEKERIAQALLQPPASNPSDNAPASTSNNTTDNKVAVPASAEVPTPSTGSLALNTDVRMDDVNHAGFSPSKSPTHERHNEAKTPPPLPQHLTVTESPKETMEIDTWNRDPDGVKDDVKPADPLSFRPSPVSSLPSRPRGPPTDPLYEGPRGAPPSSSSSLPARPISSGSVSNSRRTLPTPEEMYALTSLDVQEWHKSRHPPAEDGDNGASRVSTPPHLPARPSSRPPSLPPSRAPSRAPSHPPSRPRSPPTQPRSFHASSPTPPLPRSSSPSFARSGQHPSMSPDHSANSRPRPVPSGPRALRQGYPPPSTSGPSSYHGRGYSRPSPSSARGSFQSHGRSYDRDADRGRSARGRGRGGEWR